MYEFDHPQWEHYGIGIHSELWRSCKTEDGLWYEAPQVIRRKLRYGKQKARLLEWVRAQMVVALTARERRCVELRHFRGMSYREVAAVVNLHRSSAYRAVQRAIQTLRVRAEAQGGAEAIMKTKRRTPWARYYVRGRRRR